MKKLLYTIMLCFFGLLSFAQQESQFTNYMHNVLMQNPAYAGEPGSPVFTLLHRNQWIGFEGAPVSQSLSFNSPFFGKRVGIGMNLFHRSIGISTQWSASLAYSYRIQLTEETNVRLGLNGTMRYLGMDFSSDKVVVRQINDPSAANGSFSNNYTGNFGIGMYLTYKQLFLGASVPNFFPNEIGLNELSLQTATEAPHFYIMGGVLFPATDKIYLRPSIQAKYVNNAPISFDINMSVIFDKDMAVGMSYRTGVEGIGESIDMLLFYQITTKFGAGVAYDFSMGPLTRQNSGSFEVIGRYNLRSDRDDLSNPRFF